MKTEYDPETGEIVIKIGLDEAAEHEIRTLDEKIRRLQREKYDVGGSLYVMGKKLLEDNKFLDLNIFMAAHVADARDYLTMLRENHEAAAKHWIIKLYRVILIMAAKFNIDLDYMDFDVLKKAK